MSNLDYNRLLVVDDEISICRYLAGVARRMDFDVSIATDLERLKHKIFSFSPAIILLDLQMPGTDGVKILKLLQELESEARIILVSGMDERTLTTATMMGEILGLNMQGVLPKPVNLDVLQDALRSARRACLSIEPNAIQEAIESGEIRPSFQPKVCKDETGKWRTVESEALARWHHENGDVVMPNDFIGVAEESGLLPALTDSMIDQVTLQLKDWADRDMNLGASVNLSPSMLSDSEFPDRLEAKMQALGLDNSLLTLEVTESVVMNNTVVAMEILSRLRIKGFGLSIDDFGTGYSSLEQLYRMPFNELKIDMSLVKELETSKEARTIVEAIVMLAHKLNLTVCAEGVCSESIFKTLEEMGCEKMQGYHIGRPVSASQIEKQVACWNELQTA